MKDFLGMKSAKVSPSFCFIGDIQKERSCYKAYGKCFHMITTGSSHEQLNYHQQVLQTVDDETTFVIIIG